MPASKRRYGYDKTGEAARVRSLLEMFEGPRRKRAKTKDSDSDSSDDFFKRRREENRERHSITLPVRLIRC